MTSECEKGRELTETEAKNFGKGCATIIVKLIEMPVKFYVYYLIIVALRKYIG